MNQIIITEGSGGYGSPLVIKPTDKKSRVMYITGGNESAILKCIVELTGLIPVNGFKMKVPDEEIAVAIVDCGGVMRCGVYPQKDIPTVNTRNTGKAGPFVKFITPEIYVFGVAKDHQTQLLEEQVLMDFKVNTRVKEVGSDTISSVKENMMLFFGDMAPEDPRQYCFILNSHEFYEEIRSRDLLLVDGYVYTIKEVGNVTNENLKNLGHITLRFQYDESEIPRGSTYSKEPLIHELHRDSTIAVKSVSMQDKL